MPAAADAKAPTGVRTGRVPDFFIVGHPKSGTSALHRMLREHPQLYMPRKEPSFFVPELISPAKYPNGIDDYKALFADAEPGQLVGESTTWYLSSHTAAARIAEAQPQARIVAILREPAGFLRSLHLQFLRSDVETEPDLRSALALERQRSEGHRLPRNSTRPQLLGYSEHVRYVEQLRRYRELFGAERMLVLIYEDFRADNEATVRQVLRFLEIDDTLPVRTIEANPSVGFRAPRLNEHVRSLYLGNGPAAGALKAAVKALSTQRVRHAALGALRRRQAESPPALDAELMAELRERFRGEVQALGEYLDRDLIGFWGYGPG
jgi:Sulfotransferase domain